MITYKLICQAAFLAPKKSFRLFIKGYWQTCDDKNGGIAVVEVMGGEVVDVTGAEVVVVDVFVQGFRTILVKTTRLRDPGPKLVRHLEGK